MELRKLSLERYKGYAEPVEIELAPLTILVGANNAGKTALAQAIQLFAGGLAPSENDLSEPFPLVSGGIHHGNTFEDLVTGRTAHGSLGLSANWTNNGHGIVALRHCKECRGAASSIGTSDLGVESREWQR